MTKRHLERPHGTRDFAMEEMAHRQRIRDELLRTFARWGYTAVETPLLEYAAVFAQGVHERDEERLYRLFDAFGQTLALRPEMTTPVARVAATLMAREPLPLRLCYSAKTYREQGQRAREAAEVTQVGVELLGAGSADGDAEVIALMVGCLRSLGLADFRIALGHVGYVRALLAAASRPVREELIGALMERDVVAYERVLIDALATVDEASTAALYALPRMRGGRAALAEARACAHTAEAQAACLELEELFAALCAHGVEEFVHLDMGLYPHHEYYTGVVIEGYAQQLGQRICFGGRYDELLARFGRPLAATGCVLHLERLQEVVAPDHTARALVLLQYKSASRQEALGFARDLRTRGYEVSATCTDDPSADLDWLQQNAERSGHVRRGAIGWDAKGLQGDPLLAQMFAQFCEKERV